MTTGELLLANWEWEPSVVAGCALLALGYLWLTRNRTPARTVSFFGGVLLLLLDLVSPLDALGDEYLFSAHVLQHFLLALLIPILLLVGVPKWVADAALRRPAIARIEHVLARPATAWLLGVGTMIGWHVPVLFNAALANSVLHVVQHLSFLVTGTIFWWPVLQPAVERRLTAFAAISYLFTACLSCTILGAILSFAPPGAYPAYLNPEDSRHILPLIRNEWGLDPKNDQQAGGLLMWVPGCLVYLSAILAGVARWYGAEAREASR